MFINIFIRAPIPKIMSVGRIAYPDKRYSAQYCIKEYSESTVICKIDEESLDYVLACPDGPTCKFSDNVSGHLDNFITLNIG